MAPNFPLKDITNLEFCNICGLDDHSLEDCMKILEKVINTKL